MCLPSINRTVTKATHKHIIFFYITHASGWIFYSPMGWLPTELDWAPCLRLCVALSIAGLCLSPPQLFSLSEAQMSSRPLLVWLCRELIRAGWTSFCTHPHLSMLWPYPPPSSHKALSLTVSFPGGHSHRWGDPLGKVPRPDESHPGSSH